MRSQAKFISLLDFGMPTLLDNGIPKYRVLGSLALVRSLSADNIITKTGPVALT